MSYNNEEKMNLLASILQSISENANPYTYKDIIMEVQKGEKEQCKKQK